MKLLKPISKNSTIRTTFYIFEIAAAVFFLYYFIFGIIDAVQWDNFLMFVSDLFSGVFNCLILYGVGRAIDVINANRAKPKEENKIKEEDISKQD